MNKYIQNPDVVLREEDEDGGLLFNPDTNQVKVVNQTGLFIWKQFGDEKTVSQVVRFISDEFSDVPVERIDEDVEEFVRELLATGFLGQLN